MSRSKAVPRRPRSLPIRALLGLMGFAVSFGASPAAAGPPAGTPIDNVAFATGRDSTGSPLRSSSDTVRVVVQAAPAAVPPALAFFTDGSYANSTTGAPASRPLYVEAAAPGCDLDPGSVDSVSITLTSVRTGDTQSFVAVESGSATGRFRIEPYVPTTLVTAGGSAHPSGVLGISADDEIVATLLGCGAVRTEAHLWIDPAGVVFDSRTNAPVAGARVTLVDVSGQGNGGQPGSPALVFASDGVTPAPSVVLTDASGRFVFASVRPSTYRVYVSAPVGYRFPSQRPLQSLPASRTIDLPGSYGGNFASSLPAAPVRFDVPLDGLPSSALFVEKTAGSAVAELGDLVEFTVRVESRSDTAFTGAEVIDRLPVGFAYLRGSARRDSIAIGDPAGGAGPELRFALGALGVHQTARLRYRVRIGPAAAEGDGVNRAYASAGEVVSNTASARVAVSKGVFADEAGIVGTIFVDRDRDQRRGGDETGVPGVRVVLDDGTFAITDGAGRFSFSGLAPRTHALRIERGTLPPAARFVPLDHRDGGSGTRFVDLTRGDLEHADFALAPDTSVIRMIAARARESGGTGEIRRTLRGDGSWAAENRDGGDPRGRPSSGISTGESRLPLFDDGAEARDDPAAAPDRVARATTPAALDQATDVALEGLLRHLSSDVGFVGLAEGDTLPTDRVTVRVKGETDVPFQLWVNGDPVSPSRVGRRLQLPDGELEAWEYVGVAMKPGLNRIEVAQHGACGEEHGRAALQLLAPDALGRVAIDLPTRAPADGHSIAALRVRPLDRNGVAVTSRTLVTLETTLGRWQVADLDPSTPGIQAAVERGEGRFELLPPTQPGLAVLRVASGSVSAETTLAFVPDLRPLLAVGVVEGVLGLSGRSRGADPTGERSGFETPISQFMSQRRDGRASAAARAALYLKGRVRDAWLVTLGYDTDKPEGLRRFRDLQPDAFYPVMGDASVRGFEAQSTGRLYARLDRPGATLLYGDFVAQTTGGSHRLAAFSRSMTGAAQHFEDGRVRLDAFTSRDRSHRRLDELRGLGTSGPYLLTQSPMLENTERIEIVTRDRDQPSVVLRAEPRARFTDYEVDPLAGRIVFKSPVPSFDSDLNPVSVRIEYEVEALGDPFWVSGGEARVAVTRALELGGTYVDDQHPGEASELRGLSAALRVGASTRLEAEVARTRKLGDPAGAGGRIEVAHDDPSLQLRAYAAITDSAFSNPSAGFGAGRAEASLHLARRFDPRTQLRAEALYSADAGGAERRGGVLAVMDRSLSKALRGELGMRFADAGARAGAATTAPAPPAEFAVRGRIAAQWPRHPSLSGFGEIEQNLEDSRRMAALGGEYRYSARGRFYLRHELISSLRGPAALDASQRRLASVAGVDADLPAFSHLFSEYRLADAIAGRDAEAAVGLRTGWPVSHELRVNTSFERVSPLLGSSTGPTTAVTAAFEYSDDDDWKATSRCEIRTARASDGFLASMGMAGRMTPSWTALGRTLIDYQNLRSQGRRLRDRMQLGLAWRPASGGWDGLGRYELHYDRGLEPASPSLRRVAHVVSLHAAGPVRGGCDASLAWAAKRVYQSDEPGSSTLAQWVHGRMLRDLGASWDLGLSASTLLQGGTARRDGLGAEIGRRMRGGLWLSAGWNYFGYQDPDLPDEEYTQRGAFLRLRASIDDDLLRPWTGGGK